VKSKLQKIINRLNRKFLITHIIWDFDGTLYHNKSMVKGLKKLYFSYINNHKKISQKEFNKLLKKLGKYSKVASHYLNKPEKKILDEIDVSTLFNSFLKKDKKIVSWIENMTQFQHIILSNSTTKSVKTGLNKIGFKRKQDLEFYPFVKIIGCDQLKQAKPHKNAFENVVNYTNQSKVRHLMIGDSWENDVNPAKKFGIQAVHVDDVKQFFS
jgi:FMN phosphatase YigB (HAD superfamily)